LSRGLPRRDRLEPHRPTTRIQAESDLRVVPLERLGADHPGGIGDLDRVPQFVRERRGVRHDRPVAIELDDQQASVGCRRVHLEERGSAIQGERRQGSHPHVDDDR